MLFSSNHELFDSVGIKGAFVLVDYHVFGKRSPSLCRHPLALLSTPAFLKERSLFLCKTLYV
jgi:hypothetical protein